MYILAGVICVCLVAIDQVSKYYAGVFLAPVGSVTLIDGFFSLTLVENTGAAFGLMQGARIVFLIITPIVLGATVFYYTRLPKTRLYSWVRVALVLIISGALGNLIDRAIRGYVIDFFHATFIDFPVFNVADIYVVTGTLLLAFLLIFFIKDDEPWNLKQEKESV